MEKHNLMFRNTEEQNQEALVSRLWESEDEKHLISFMESKFGVDIRDPKAFPVGKANFSWKAVKDKLREADSMSIFPQVLRAGVQQLVNAAYQKQISVTYDQWMHTVASTKLEELYAPLQGISFPKGVAETEVFPESYAAGLDIRLRNKKFGTLYPVSRELVDYDQSGGQFQQVAGLMGQYARQVFEVLAYGKLASVANMSYGGLDVPVSETKPATEATWPWSTSLVGGGATRPVAYGALNQANIQSAFVALMNQKNLLGLKMSVEPDTLIISPVYNFDLAVLLNSAYYPTGATAGQTGGAFSINPLEGLAKKVVSRFMVDHLGSFSGNSKRWVLCDSKKSWAVAQVNEASVVELEDPLSGRSFESDLIRLKLRVRGNCDLLDSRFAFTGNDGSV